MYLVFYKLVYTMDIFLRTNMKDYDWFRKTYFPMLPDSYTHDMRLNATEQAMTQTGRMILYATYALYCRKLDSLFAKFRSYDTVSDLIWTHYQMALSHFIKHKVLRHKYDRRYSFWQNCLSSVRSVHHGVWYIYDRWDRDSRLSDSWDTTDDDKRPLSDTVCRKILPVSYRDVRKSDEELRQEDREILGLD